MNSWKSSASTTVPATEADWCWPVDLSSYDRTAKLRPKECLAIKPILARVRLPKDLLSQTIGTALDRLSRPVLDVMEITGARMHVRTGVMGLLAIEMFRLQRAYWGWTRVEWIEIMGNSVRYFKRRYSVQGDCRQHLIALSFLLGCFTDLSALGAFERLGLARKVFGRVRVDEAIQRVLTTIEGWGYKVSMARKELPLAVCETLLANRSPRLTDLTVEFLERRRSQDISSHVKETLFAISRVLYSLGITNRPVRNSYEPAVPNHLHDAKADVDKDWLDWCRRWRDTSTLSPKSRYRHYLLVIKAGRWLKKLHPKIVGPEGWTREVAAAYVAAVCRMAVGDWAPLKGGWVKHRGKPLSAKSRMHHLAAMSAFFQDCQEWNWISRRFDPRRCFSRPVSLGLLCAPNPRVISDEVWAKLLWAGLNLTETDICARVIAIRHYYPLEMVRAIALVWLFAGLRSDEIRRLSVGCIRWQENTNGSLAIGQDAERRAVCLLAVPANKTSAAFTKPVDRVVGEAITSWERSRPNQPAAVDAKTGAVVHYLFAFRGKVISSSYLNNTVIPLLCRKAGVSRQDARGNITSHRGRSTIASQLFNAREPLSLFELQQWLGHRNPSSTQYYAKITPTRLSKSYADADYFRRNIRTVEVLIDQEAVKSGAARNEPWKFYDLGHGYCTYEFFDQCPHRMACAKCSFYRAKGSTEAQLLEGKSNLVRMRQDIPLGEAELAAVDDGLAAYERLLLQLADVRTPAGPTPRELCNELVELRPPSEVRDWNAKV